MRQSVFSRLAGYEDTNDAERLSVDPTMRQVVGGRATEHTAASTSQMGRFETEVLTQQGNLKALTKLSGKWIDRLRKRQPMRELNLDMDSSVSETYGEQEGTAFNGHFGCTCYHPLFCFNQFGDVEQSLLREGNVHSAKEWRAVLEPVVARYQSRNIPRYFRADAAFANPELYEYLEAEGFEYAIRLPGNDALLRDIEPMLTGGASVERAGGLLCRLFVSGKELESGPARGGQGGVAQWRTIPSHRVHRDQSNSARQTGECGSTTSVARRSSGSRKARTRSNGPACPVTTLWTTRCGCNCSCWPTTWATFCGRRYCPERCVTGR